MDQIICPLCNVATEAGPDRDYPQRCPNCTREWTADGLRSKRRRVQLLGPIVPGAKLNELIVPAEDRKPE